MCWSLHLPLLFQSRLSKMRFKRNRNGIFRQFSPQIFFFRLVHLEGSIIWRNNLKCFNLLRVCENVKTKSLSNKFSHQFCSFSPYTHVIVICGHAFKHATDAGRFRSLFRLFPIFPMIMVPWELDPYGPVRALIPS